MLGAYQFGVPKLLILLLLSHFGNIVFWKQMIECRKEDHTKIYGVYSEENNFQKTEHQLQLYFNFIWKKKRICKGTTDTGLQVAFALNLEGTVTLSFTNTVKGPLSGD